MNSTIDLQAIKSERCFRLNYFALLALIAVVTVSRNYAQVYNITDFGAVGNGSTVNTAAIQAAIDTCSITGGTVLVPTGTFVTGTLVLKSNVTLEIHGTLQGSPNISHYPDYISALRSMADASSQKSLLYAEQASHITLTGNGTINGNGLAFLGASNRPYGIRFISCRNVRYENIRLENAAFWMMHNQDIDTLVIRNVTIFNNANSNNDGIGVDGCRNVLIENCTVSSLDDPLVFKTTAPLNCENIVVQNCTLSTVARAIKIGTETAGGFRNILIKNCVVEPHILTADCGINLAIVDGGFIDGLTLQNIVISGVNTALSIRLGNQGRKYTPTAPVPPVGYIRNITLQDITIHAESNLSSTISGIPGYYVDNILLENFTVYFPGGMGTFPASFVVPENETARPNCDVLGDSIPAHGVFMRHVRNMRLQNVCFHASAADQRPAVVADDVVDSSPFVIIPSGNSVCVDALPSAVVAERENNPAITILEGGQTVLIASKGQAVITDAELFDATGKRIWSKTVHAREFRFDFSAQKGVYFCKIKFSSETSFTFKLVR
ncbi:MAG: hypothetical protein KatS3mg031_1843 [Chitinophagales bacterium]|nr:MAG: hypothetical protein KatS3mg031_1843 [Chitinophagales bacterium]